MRQRRTIRRKCLRRRRTLKGGSWRGAQCSPSISSNKGGTGTGTCFTLDELTELKKKWNVLHVADPLTETDPKKIVTFFRKKMATCETERCWLSSLSLSSGKLEDALAPTAPASWNKNPNEWLTDEDIRKVMHQYERAYPCFKFIGPSPIDFDKRIKDNECVWEELCHFRFPKGKTKIGMVFNTDPHDKEGEHWISMFISIPKKIIYFFDSTGEPCTGQILTLVKRIQHLSPIPLEFKQNTKEHQFSSTECGMYSLFFIINMLRDKIDAEFLATHQLKDDYIAKFRNIYFNHHGAPSSASRCPYRQHSQTIKTLYYEENQNQ